ncbi:hypothetical protein [Methanosarcina soligelidi]|uniref:hypothetical protein n=1 Tax=Methanosarcina soligelidi TaxID=1036677 RepID=UPI00064FACF4|nr:hypothetical protein [Methanosarcina soligelidi]
MANTRKGYKRIMGEIPVETHEKITQYNKITDRPLNVSKAIEICMEQAIKKIDEELITYAANNKDAKGIISDEYYKVLRKDIDDGLLGPKAIHKHFVEMMKKDGGELISAARRTFNDSGRIPLYPINKVQLDINGSIDFCVNDVVCFVICAPYSDVDKKASEDFEGLDESY